MKKVNKALFALGVLYLFFGLLAIIPLQKLNELYADFGNNRPINGYIFVGGLITWGGRNDTIEFFETI